LRINPAQIFLIARVCRVSFIKNFSAVDGWNRFSISYLSEGLSWDFEFSTNSMMKYSFAFAKVNLLGLGGTGIREHSEQWELRYVKIIAEDLRNKIWRVISRNLWLALRKNYNQRLIDRTITSYANAVIRSVCHEFKSRYFTVVVIFLLHRTRHANGITIIYAGLFSFIFPYVNVYITILTLRIFFFRA